MPEAKTRPTAVSVKAFIAAIAHDTRREDAQALLKTFQKVTGWKPKMWGPSIIGFGTYHYTYETGRSGTAPAVGFSPRKGNFVVYVFDFDGKAALLKKLGKHKGGLEQCLYINKLADIDIAVLAKILKGGIGAAKKAWPVTAS